MSIKVKIDTSVCAGTGFCTQIAPEAFKLGANNKGEVINNSKSLEDMIREAEENCPLGAIIIEEN